MTVKPAFYTRVDYQLLKTVQMLFMLKHPDLGNLNIISELGHILQRSVVFCFAQLPVWSVYVCPVALCLSVQRALKILQPAILEEFLGAVEGFGAFCTGPQIQDMMLLSDSVSNQWEV